MRCSQCGFIESKVIDSRSIDDGIRRRRQCLKCGARFTTVERYQQKSIFVIKKDGRREEFNRDKLLSGVRKACEKRPLPTGTIDKLIDGIENELYTTGKAEIECSLIGDLVMERLRDLDHIAYIRFASVYREFTDISTLKQAVDTLIDTNNSTPPDGQLALITKEQLKAKGKLRRRRTS
ncbi:MAG TPA: transcriptional repressor NrdR [Dehalococcoidia bacterium]|nr:transcriptional repressor NrdR [Dehalococcoidia bacterium]